MRRHWDADGSVCGRAQAAGGRRKQREGVRSERGWNVTGSCGGEARRSGFLTREGNAGRPGRGQCGKDRRARNGYRDEGSEVEEIRELCGQKLQERVESPRGLALQDGVEARGVQSQKRGVLAAGERGGEIVGTGVVFVVGVYGEVEGGTGRGGGHGRERRAAPVRVRVQGKREGF